MQTRPTAVVVIYSAAVLHLVEAFIVGDSTAADNSIPIASLLTAFDGQHLVLAATLMMSALLALAAATQRPGVLAMFGLIPQQSLLLITAIGAVVYAVMGHYADGYEPDGGGLFIAADQLPRIVLAIAHAVASYQWFWFNHMPRWKRSKVDRILAAATWVSHGNDPDADDLVLIPVDELREIVESQI